MTKRGISTFALIASLTCLSGCTWPFGYNFIPDGYRYNDNTPLSSPAPSSPWYKDADHPNLDAMADNTAAWQGAVYELISPLPNLVPPGQARLVLKTRPPAYTADNAFDHYLRAGLISYGYTIANSADAGGVTLVYDAAPLEREDIRKLAKDRFGQEFLPGEKMKGQYYLTLQVVGPDKKLITDQATIAVLPYEKDEYNRWPGLTTQPTQGWRLDKPAVYDTRD